MLCTHRTFFSLHVSFPKHLLLDADIMYQVTFGEVASSTLPSALKSTAATFLLVTFFSFSLLLLLLAPHPLQNEESLKEWRVFNLKIKCPFGKWKIIFSQAHFNLTQNSKSFTIHFSIIIKAWSMYTSCHRQLSSLFTHFFLSSDVMENRYASEETPAGELRKRRGWRRPTSS